MEAASLLSAGNAPPWVLRKQALLPPRSTQFIRSPIYSSRLRLSHSLPRCSNDAGSEQRRAQSLDQALKFCYAINEGSVHGIVDSLEEIAPLPESFTPLLWFLKGKNVFSSLMKLLRNSVEFVFIPKDDGTVVGVSWRLAWRTTHQPTGRDCFFDAAHVYRGRIFIRNVEKLLDPVQELMAIFSKRIIECVGWSGDQEKKTWWRKLQLVAFLFVPVVAWLSGSQLADQKRGK